MLPEDGPELKIDTFLTDLKLEIYDFSIPGRSRLSAELKIDTGGPATQSSTTPRAVPVLRPLELRRRRHGHVFPFYIYKLPIDRLSGCYW